MKTRYLIIGIVLTIAAEFGIAQSKTNIDSFSWLVGTWEMKVKNGALYESWLMLKDGSLQSKGFKVKSNGDTIPLESVQIAHKNDSYYYTSTVSDQNNRQPVPFKMTSVKKNEFIAENPVHDFPQRISYALQMDGSLYAFIDGKEKGQYKKSEFMYQRVTPNGSPNQLATMRLFDAFNKHDWKTFSECYAIDADFLDPSYGKEYVKQTHQQLIDKYSGFQKAIPDINDEVVGIYEDGEKIIVEFISSGTLPDGKKWKLPICSVLTYKDGKIIRDATYFDDEK